MATLAELYQLRFSLATEAFFQRVVAAVVTAAFAVLYEDPGTPNHAARTAWADAVLATDATTPAQQMLWGLVVNPTIATALLAGEQPPDNDIQFVVNGLVDTFATGG